MIVGSWEPPFVCIVLKFCKDVEAGRFWIEEVFKKSDSCYNDNTFGVCANSNTGFITTRNRDESCLRIVVSK
jgi:hypothetical protein